MEFDSLWSGLQYESEPINNQLQHVMLKYIMKYNRVNNCCTLLFMVYLSDLSWYSFGLNFITQGRPHFMMLALPGRIFFSFFHLTRIFQNTNIETNKRKYQSSTFVNASLEYMLWICFYRKLIILSYKDEVIP